MSKEQDAGPFGSDEMESRCAHAIVRGLRIGRFFVWKTRRSHMMHADRNFSSVVHATWVVEHERTGLTRLCASLPDALQFADALSVVMPEYEGDDVDEYLSLLTSNLRAWCEGSLTYTDPPGFRRGVAAESRVIEL